MIPQPISVEKFIAFPHCTADLFSVPFEDASGLRLRAKLLNELSRELERVCKAHARDAPLVAFLTDKPHQRFCDLGNDDFDAGSPIRKMTQGRQMLACKPCVQRLPVSFASWCEVRHG